MPCFLVEKRPRILAATNVPVGFLSPWSFDETRFQHGLLVKLLAINADASGMDARLRGVDRPPPSMSRSFPRNSRPYDQGWKKHQPTWDIFGEMSNDQLKTMVG